MTRDTTTGSHFENIVETCLQRAAKIDNFTLKKQSTVGEKPGGNSNHRVDWELIHIEKPDLRGLLSCKFQGTSGTAEEKIAYEVIKLLNTMSIDTRYKHSWIALGGEGWSSSMVSFIKNDLIKWIPEAKDKITIFLNPNELISSNIRLTDYIE